VDLEMEAKMQILKDTIMKYGIVKDHKILKVDSFLNHQIDPVLMDQIGDAFCQHFADQKITKVLTIEASGIAIGLATARILSVPLVFAKKVESFNLDADTYHTEVFSYTKNKSYPVRVSKRFLQPTDRVLIVDDFLADGNAALGLIDLVKQAGAELSGLGIVIEKGFQPGGELLRSLHIPLHSLAIIDSMSPEFIAFRTSI
jgi:xanthine phosphoribosyltransferase